MRLKPVAIPALYDWLSRYVQLANWRAYGDRYAGLTMHKPLAVDDGEPIHAVNDRLLAAAHLPPEPRVLDAGCGFGGTILRWAQRIGGTYDGLTLSRVQRRVAQREARRRGLEARCRFHLRSFDDPIAERYDAIVAIETLVHSPHFARSFANLAGALAPGGALLLVEDVPSGGVPPHDAELLAKHWSCPRLPSERDYREAFAREGLTLEYEEDLTAHVRMRDAAAVDRAERRYQRLWRLLPFPPARAVLAAYLGGMAIERLYATGRLHYRLFVARRVEA
ncbi:MAG: Methyltransferase type 12 [Acidobacteria bacterium]|nr:Methyltransferase type 12 [Acidobacteriota bacterium]